MAISGLGLSTGCMNFTN